MIFSSDLKVARESLSRTDAGRDFHDDGTALHTIHSCIFTFQSLSAIGDVLQTAVLLQQRLLRSYRMSQ